MLHIVLFHTIFLPLCIHNFMASVATLHTCCHPPPPFVIPLGPGPFTGFMQRVEEQTSPIFQALHTVTCICASFAVGAFSQPVRRRRDLLQHAVGGVSFPKIYSIPFLFLDAFQETVFRGVGGRESRFKGLNLKGRGALIP